MTVDEALTLWQNKEAIIIDIRTKEEYLEGHIPDASFIPVRELESYLSELPESEKVLLVCHSGNRSGRTTGLLKSKGFDNVYNMDGGMLAWRGPVVK